MESIMKNLLAQGHKHSHGEDDPHDVLVAKIVAMVVLFVASLLFGLLPILLSKKFKWMDDESSKDIKNTNKVIVGLLSFGGGALLCTTFLHLLPEVGHNIVILQEEGTIAELSFHLESLLMCLGFFTMYLVEELVHFYLDKRAKKQSRRATESSLVRTLSVRHSIMNNNRLPTISTTDLITKDVEKPVENVSTIIPHCEEEHVGKHGHSHSHLPMMSQGDDPVIASLRGLLIVLALSVHELFEGLAVGLESSAKNVWYMFGAISAHKLVLAFCVGVELVTTRTKPLLVCLYTFTFAIVSPIGIGIGIGISGGEGAAASGLASVILQGLASGTLLYVIFFEILQRERAGLLQLGCAVIGFGVMFGLKLIVPHEHGHSHGDHHD